MNKLLLQSKLFSNNFLFKNTLNFNKSFLFSTLTKNNPTSSLNYNIVANKSELTKPKFYFISLFCIRSLFKKRNTFIKSNKGYKMKDRKALRKRLIIVGPSFNRHFLFHRVGFYHKRNKKSRANKAKPTFKLIGMTNKRYILRNLPNFKTKRCKLGRKNTL